MTKLWEVGPRGGTSIRSMDSGGLKKCWDFCNTKQSQHKSAHQGCGGTKDLGEQL